MNQDFHMLCSVLDSGDLSVLPALCDCLEELGDPRADGLRARGHYKPRMLPQIQRYAAWFSTARWPLKEADASSLPPEVFAELAMHRYKNSAYAEYESVSLAWLALADALSKTQKSAS